MTLKKHIVVLAVFLRLSAFALSGCVFFADNAIEKLPYAGVANFNPLEGSEPIKVSYFDKISKRVRTKHYSFTSETQVQHLTDDTVNSLLMRTANQITGDDTISDMIRKAK